MNKQIFPLLIAQFLSVFADNAVLFTVIAIVMKSAHPGKLVHTRPAKRISDRICSAGTLGRRSCRSICKNPEY